MDNDDQDLYEFDPSSRTSPQGTVIDYLIWDRLSKFWVSAYRREDREALNAIYEASGRVLDAEMVRLEEINRAKSIFTCPIASQRRWVRLELNRFREIQSFLTFAVTGRLPGGAAGYVSCGTGSGSPGTPGSGADRFLQCTDTSESHAAHWHISFTWKLVGAAAADRRTINLRYPLRPALTEVWRMDTDSAGRRSGTKLVFGVDFSILGDGTSIRLNEGDEGDLYDVVVALDFTDRNAFNGRLPAVRAITGPYPGLRTVTVPPELDGYPVHLELVQGVPPVVGGALQDSNNSSFTSTSEFVVNTGDIATGAFNAAPGVVAYPVSRPALSSGDIVFAFGLERVDDNAAFTRLHAHEQFSFYVALNSAVLPGGVVSVLSPVASVSEIVLPNGNVPVGYNGSIDHLGQELRVFIDGRKLHRSEYRYSVPTNTLYLRIPIALTSDSFARIDIQYTREFEGLPSQTLELHNHVSCYKQNARPVAEYQTFDDGGDFDVDSEEIVDPPWGIFDSAASTSALFLADLNVDEATLRVYLDGRLLFLGVDYVVSLVPGDADTPARTRIVFSQDISGRTVEVTYRRAGSILTYGFGGLSGSTTCTSSYLTRDGVDQILGNVGALLNNFIDVYGPVQNPEALVEALRILAAGGNPFFALFADEFSAYQKYPINADNQPITAADARALESTNTKLVAIPVLVDHPHRPTIRLMQDEDFVIRDGGIGSSRDLTASRGPEDAEPGVWWCPVLVLDESLLARTFGSLVGDVRDLSTPQYRDALIANHLTRWSGPVSNAIESAASVFLGSPIFQQDGRVSVINEVVSAYAVTVRGPSADKTYIIEAGRPIPPAGSLVFAGQSIASPLAFESVLATYRGWNGASLILDGKFEIVQRGDLLWVEMFQRGTAASTWVRLTVEDVQLRLNMAEPTRNETVVTFRERVQSAGLYPSISSRYKASRPAGAPFADFSGVVDTVESLSNWVITTSAGESFYIPRGLPLTYRIGTEVRRGDAVLNTLAKLYDDAERKDWLWLKPEQDDSYQHLFNGGVSRGIDETDDRFVTVEPGKNGFSKMTLSRVSPLPPRGTIVTVTLDNAGLVERYQVVGSNASSLNVIPEVSARRSGLARFDWPRVGVRAEYFELPPPTGVSGQLVSPHSLNSPSLQLIDTSGFPPAGRIGLALGGGVIEVDYYRVSGNFLTDLSWSSAVGHEALIDNDGRLIPTIPETSVVILSEYSRRILNPAMEALIKTRVENDLGTTTGAPRISNLIADQYYDLFKNNSSVLELSAVGTPSALRLLLEDVVPPSTTLVVLSRHVIADAFEAGAKDG